MTPFDRTQFCPAVQALLPPNHLQPLDAGSADGACRARLEALAADGAFAPHQVRDRAAADACRAGLWLYHNFLDEAHAVSQELDTPAGGYWHGLMHRREPDYGKP